MTISHRIALTQTPEGYAVQGCRSPRTGMTSASYVSRFPGDSEPAQAAEFPGVGTVWSTTTVRIPSGEYAADRVILYVDLDGGPRVLCESAGPVAVGSRVRIDRLNEQGDPVVMAA